MVIRLAIFFLWIAAVSGETAMAQAPSGYHVKAAFIYNFLKFVEWPEERFASAGTPYVVGVLGRDPFGGVLDATMRGKNVNGRQITVVRVTEKDMSRCHLLFISSSEQRRYSELCKQLEAASVLTVGEGLNFAENGGGVEFYTQQNKIRFQINAEATKRSNLRIHPTLLSLAQLVKAP